MRKLIIFLSILLFLPSVASANLIVPFYFYSLPLIHLVVLIEGIIFYNLANNVFKAGKIAKKIAFLVIYDNFFRGSLDDLAGAREAVELPVLRKDFILDPYQVYEARGCAADAVLLIAAILSPSELAALIELAHSLGMSALVEVHHREEVAKALACGARIIGINNRNLADFSVDLSTTSKLRPLIPPDSPVVSESGIHSQADVLLLSRAGVNAILVGEMLVTSADPAAKIRELLAEVASPR